MIPVSDELKDAYNDGTQKNLILAFSESPTLDNTNIVAESMSIDQILCDNQQLTFGLCSSSSFKVRTLYVSASRVGQTIMPTIVAHKNGEDYPLALGQYKIITDKATDDRLYRDITAYDSLYDVLNNDYSGWYESLSFPMTLKDYRDSFFNFIGIVQESANLINDSMVIEKTVELDIYSGKDVLRHILEINAVCGFINFQGHFQYVPFANEGGLYPDDDVFPADDLYPEDGYDVLVDGNIYSYINGSYVYEDYVFKKITGLLISEGEEGESHFYGRDNNVYNISGNYLLFGKSDADLSAVAGNFLAFVRNFIYNPAKVRLRAMPWVELGDIIGITGKKGASVFPILRRTMSGITGLYDFYEAKGLEYLTYSSNATSKVTEKLKSRTRSLENTVGEYEEQFQEIDEALDTQAVLISQLTQTVATKVSKTSVIADINASTESGRIGASKIDTDAIVGRIAALENALATTGDTVSVETYGGTISYERTGNTITITGEEIGTTSAITTEVSIAVLPSGYRPNGTFKTVGFSGSSVHPFTLDADGNIYVANTSNGSFKVTYVV